MSGKNPVIFDPRMIRKQLGLFDCATTGRRVKDVMADHYDALSTTITASSADAVLGSLTMLKEAGVIGREPEPPAHLQDSSMLRVRSNLLSSTDIIIMSSQRNFNRIIADDYEGSPNPTTNFCEPRIHLDGKFSRGTADDRAPRMPAASFDCSTSTLMKSSRFLAKHSKSFSCVIPADAKNDFVR